MITPEQIKAARKASGLSQEQAGAVVYSTGSAWQKWELGDRKMPRAKYELFIEKTKPLKEK